MDAHTIAMNDDNDQQGNKVITGRWTSAWHGSHWYGGWSPEGLNHFNQLVKIVKQDRENDKHFLAQYEIWLNEREKKKPKESQASCSQSLSWSIIIGSVILTSNICLIYNVNTYKTILNDYYFSSNKTCFYWLLCMQTKSKKWRVWSQCWKKQSHINTW